MDVITMNEMNELKELVNKYYVLDIMRKRKDQIQRVFEMTASPNNEMIKLFDSDTEDIDYELCKIIYEIDTYVRAHQIGRNILFEILKEKSPELVSELMN